MHTCMCFEPSPQMYTFHVSELVRSHTIFVRIDNKIVTLLNTQVYSLVSVKLVLLMCVAKLEVRLRARILGTTVCEIKICLLFSQQILKYPIIFTLAAFKKAKRTEI